jgi:hypothetical protein
MAVEDIPLTNPGRRLQIVLQRDPLPHPGLRRTLGCFIRFLFGVNR